MMTFLSGLKMLIMIRKGNIEAKTVKVHFANGKVNGYFDIQKNKESDCFRFATMQSIRK